MRDIPTAYNSAVSTKGMMMYGGHVHPAERIWRLLEFAQSGSTLALAATVIITNFTNFVRHCMLVTRAQNPARDCPGDYHDGECQAEYNSEQNLKICAIEWPSALLSCIAWDCPVRRHSHNKAADRHQGTNNGNQMQNVVVTG